ncbi:hypothetical protein WJX72_011919 [[Myrmecia] bisecta]|uniref:RING-type E3 ubiquitin transferase (cysteine targeting) n=1 Tax=[Myrmecia] bisecta TaxID=41462 RepID=A0AAW1R9X8_9CHLO
MSAELHWRWISLSGPYGKQLCIRKDSRVEQSAQLADDCKHLLVPLTDQQSVLEQFAPAIKLHPYEQAFPCSIEHILQHSTLKSVKQPDWSGLRSPSPDVLGRCRKAAEDAALAQELGLPANQGEQALYLDIQADAYKGFSPGSSHGEYVSSDSHTVCAPMYVSIERYANKDYVDLHYIMLYAYQACQTFRITTLAGAVTSLFSRKTPTTDHFVIHDFGRHQGDIERVCVRVDPGFTKIYAVGFERHGKDCWDPANSMRFPRDQLELEGGTHTVVCAAMNGHASYNSRERGTTDFTKTTVADSPLKGEHAFKTGGVEGVWGIDLCDDAHGPVWRPWTAGSRVVLLNRDELNGNVLAGAEWATFQGGLGAPLHNKFRGATHIDGCKVDLAKGLQLRAINIGAKVAQCAVPKFHLPGAGGGAPAGLGNRPYMRMWRLADPTAEDWQTEWFAVLPELEQLARRRKSAPDAVIMRASQLDAFRLDSELTAMLREQFMRIFALFQPRVISALQPELVLLLDFLIFRFSVWSGKPTPGSALMNLRYRDERRTSGPPASPHTSSPEALSQAQPSDRISGQGGAQTGVEGPGLTRWQRGLYGAGMVFVRYAWARAEQLAISRHWGDRPEQDWGRRTWQVLRWTETGYKLASLLNFLAFLRHGKYRSLLERLLRARLVYQRSSMARAISFEYLNRQLPGSRNEPLRF